MATPDPVTTALAVGSPRQLTRALRVLSRVAIGSDQLAGTARRALDQRLPELVRQVVKHATDDDMREALRIAVAVLRPMQGATTALGELPPISTPFAGLATEIMLTAAVALEAAVAEDPDRHLPDLAWTHNNLCIGFQLQGQHDWAAAAGRQAVSRYRMLVDRTGDVHLPGLASALDNLQGALTGPDSIDEEIAVGTEAVDLYRRLAGTDGDAFRAELAHSLVNLSVGLSSIGRLAEALALTEEAVMLRRSQVAADGGAARPGLASALSNLSVDLGNAGRLDAAIDAIEEAVRIRRELVAAEPDLHRADLATSLNNLSVRLSAVGRHSEALAAVTEAVEIRRALAEGDPDQFQPDLAMSLTNLSVDLKQMGRPPAEALAATEEAVRIRRQLASTRPEIFRPALATSLHNLSADLAATGDDDKALGTLEEAVAIRRDLAARRPAVYAAALAGSLRSLAVRLAAVGRPSAAVDAADEAVQIIRAQADGDPERFRPALARALDRLSVRLGAVERYPEALAAIEEAVRIDRDLAEAAPGAYRPDLAVSLNNVAVALSRVGRTEESLAAAEEAVRIRRDLVATRPDRYLSALAASLDNVADGANKLGRPADALRAIEEVVEIRRALAAADVRAALPGLAMSILTMADHLVRLDRRADASRLFDDLLAEQSKDDWARGVVVLERASWRGLDGDVAGAVADAGDALQLLHGDPVRQAHVRNLLRTMRRVDPARFDAAWPPERGDQPAWLRHLEHDPAIDEVIHAWMESARTGTLADEQAFLARHSELLSDEAEAAFDRLIDANPGHAGLRSHQDIIRTARSADVAEAYAQYTEQMWREEVSTALARWIAATSHDDLRRRLAEDEAFLLSEEAAAQGDTMIGVARPTPETLWRIGLLAICRSDGPANAFAILTDRDTVRRTPGRSSLTAYQPRVLGLARLRAGLEPDDPEANFIHSVAALAAHLDTEANDAMVRCVDTSNSWDRPTRTRQLTRLTTIRPDLTDGLMRLRSTFVTRWNATRPTVTDR